MKLGGWVGHRVVSDTIKSDLRIIFMIMHGYYFMQFICREQIAIDPDCTYI